MVLQVFQEPTMPMYKVLSHLEGRKAEPRRFHTDCGLLLNVFLLSLFYLQNYLPPDNFVIDLSEFLGAYV